MFAVIEEGAKQYFVRQGQVIFVEKIDAQVGELVNLKDISEVGLGDVGVASSNVNVKDDNRGDSKSNMSGSRVVLEVLEHKKTDKVIVFKKKRRHNYRRKKGHRQSITVLQVKEILK